MTDIGRHDLEAIGDIADWLIEASDGLPIDKTIELLEASLAATAKMKMACDMLQAQALAIIEQPVVIGKTVWSKKRIIKRRPNQSRIAAHVVVDATGIDQATGEMRNSVEAAERAVNLMRALYVSPSTVPKTGGVEKLGLTMADVCENEHTGYELRRIETDD